MLRFLAGSRAKGVQPAGYEGAGPAAVIVRIVVVTPRCVADLVEGGTLRVEPYEGADVHGHAKGTGAEDFPDHAGVGALLVGE
ncbi:hypothetical protein [Streptomyces sp. NPDC047000]|uniref:hypothetical protein n=1 Tax=Streptomyces sp. NPDC047000 TaxID=3155474 RepID=UPI00340128A2